MTWMFNYFLTVLSRPIYHITTLINYLRLMVELKEKSLHPNRGKQGIDTIVVIQMVPPIYTCLLNTLCPLGKINASLERFVSGVSWKVTAVVVVVSTDVVKQLVITVAIIVLPHHLLAVDSFLNSLTMGLNNTDTYNVWYVNHTMVIILTCRHALITSLIQE